MVLLINFLIFLSERVGRTRFLCQLSSASLGTACSVQLPFSTYLWAFCLARRCVCPVNRTTTFKSSARSSNAHQKECTWFGQVCWASWLACLQTFFCCQILLCTVEHICSAVFIHYQFVLPLVLFSAWFNWAVCRSVNLWAACSCLFSLLSKHDCFVDLSSWYRLVLGGKFLRCRHSLPENVNASEPA